MDVYSPALGLAMAATVVSLGSVIIARRSAFGAWAGSVALVLVAVATGSHIAFGHSPGSTSALGFVAFLAEHPALGITAGAAAVSLLLSRARRVVESERGRQHSLIPALTSAARLTAYTAVMGSVGVLILRKGPDSGAWFVLAGLTAVTFLTFFVLGALGYEVQGDSVNAPRPVAWGFLFLLFAIALVLALSFLT